MFEREHMKSLALGVVGLSAGGSGRAAFAELVGAGEAPGVAESMIDSMSTCGLTVRGLWRRFGMKDARLEAPYEPASVMTTIREMATEAGGWSQDVSSIGVGDVIYISEPDHVGTVVRVDKKDDGGVELTTVDGGATDGAGKQAIVTFERALSADGTVTAGPLSGNGRRIVGIASLPKLAAQFGGGGGVGIVVVAAAGAAALAWALWKALGPKRRG